MKKNILFVMLSISILAILVSCNINDTNGNTNINGNINEFSLYKKGSSPFLPPLTPLWYNLVHSGTLQNRRIIAERLLMGFENVNAYNTGICYEVVAFVRFLYDNAITCNDLTNFRTQGWLNRFNFMLGEQWDGYSSIAGGEILGFRDESTNTFFHAAIATGDHDEIRSVNGGRLGAGWVPLRLGVVLGNRNTDGTFNFEGRKIRVYKANLNNHTEL